MTPPNFCNFRKIAKQLFIVLFVINQLIVFHYLWVSYVNDSPLNFIQSIARDATTTTKLPTTTKSPPPTPAPRFKMLYDEVKPKNESIKHVLFFNGCFGKPFWRLGKENSTAEDLKLASCPHTNCIFTHKKDYLQNIHDYDAIIFNVWYGDSDLPKTRTPSQHYILAANEAPCHLGRNFAKESNTFNLTMTYRLHSDIVWSYGEVIDLETGAVVAPDIYVQWRKVDEHFEDEELLKIVKNKTKTAAWAASNCNPPSKREVLAEKLQQFIDIDVYGACGNNTCNKKNNCEEMYGRTYKFYLAFENSLYEDYITEKLFKVLNKNILPIVFNGANMTRFLPPKSYIDANDFKTVEDLAKHIKFLSDHPREYVKYFWWKKHYRADLQEFFTLRHVCKICEKLNEENLEFKMQTYPNIKDWINKNHFHNATIKF